ncbi:MAG: type II toxin-antitoxin system VapC family toxin [Pyrinomonadaceae bacterium]
MSHLADTSILIRTIHTSSPQQQLAIEAIDELRKQQESIYIFPQNLIEFWAVATRPIESNGLGLTIAQAETKITHLKKVFILKNDNEDIYTHWENLVSKYEVKGKTSHDARLVAGMQTHSISHLLTFNVADFKRYKNIIKVLAPQDII